MAKHPSFLDRVRSTPDLARVVPHLPPEVLHRVIQACGLEDSAELLALATPQQIERMLDVDVWRAAAPGRDEQLDVDRFGTWIAVLMDSGADAAAEKIAAMDLDLIVAALSGHVRVFDAAAVSSYTTFAGEIIAERALHGDTKTEIGGYVILAKRSSAWDAIVELLAQLECDRTDYFRRLMRRCIQLSNGPREPDGFHALLEDEEQALFDLACGREERREAKGYATPAQARAFLDGARRLSVHGTAPEPTPIARAYFRALAVSSDTAGAVSGDAAGAVSGGAAPAGSADAPPEALVEPRPSVRTMSVPDPVAAFTQMLHEEGVLASTPPRALLPPSEGGTSRFPLVRSYLEAHAEGAEALAFLVNILLAGCSVQMRSFTPEEASDAAAATCNLGLENWPRRWRDRDLVTAFGIGWALLHRDVCMYAARRLVRAAGDVRCPDRDIQLRLRGMQRELERHVAAGTPWRAQPALDVLMMLDPRSWIALVAATDECPVLHAAVAGSGGRAIEPQDFSFISESRHVAAIRAFVETLPSRLRP